MSEKQNNSRERQLGFMRDFLPEACAILGEIKGRKPEWFVSSPDPGLAAHASRKLHTLKGTAGFFGLGEITELLHSAEEVLLAGILPDESGAEHFFHLIAQIEEILEQLASGERSLQPAGPAFQPDKSTDAEFERISRELASEMPGKHQHTSSQLPTVTMNTNPQQDREELPQLDPALEAEYIRISKQLLLRQYPFEDIFDKAKLLVESVAEKLGKKIVFSTEGGQLYIPKKVYDAIDKALPHILRNACDHGIETEQERRAARKKPEGKIFLHGYADEKNYYLNIFDDGRGIDTRKVRFSAVEKGVLSSDEAIAASDADILGIIFRPRLSTASSTTHLSGRGIGLDAAKTDINAAGGEISVSSHPGRGSTFTIIFAKREYVHSK